jgi:hypothetical protein
LKSFGVASHNFGQALNLKIFRIDEKYYKFECCAIMGHGAAAIEEMILSRARTHTKRH